MSNKGNYKNITFYQGKAIGTSTGFSTFSENGLYYFTCNKNDEVYLFSKGFTSAAARNRNLHKLSENLLFAKSYDRIQETKNRFYFIIKTEDQEELARSKFFATEDAMNVFIGWIMGSKFVIDYSKNSNNENSNFNTTVSKGNYNKYINYTIYKGSNQKLYFAYADKDDNTYLLNPVVSGFENVEDVKKMVETVNKVARRPKAYKVNLAKNGKYFFYLKNNTKTLAKSIHFDNEKEMLKVIEKLVNYKNVGRTVISSKLNKPNNNSTLKASQKDDFDEVLKEQQKAELEVRLKKRKQEEQTKLEQTELSLEQVLQNQLQVKDKDLAAKAIKDNNEKESQNGKLNNYEIEPPSGFSELLKDYPAVDVENEPGTELNKSVSNKKLKVHTVDANKEDNAEQPKDKNKVETDVEETKPEKKLKVRTVDANKEIAAKTIGVNKTEDAGTVKPEKKLKVRTVDANKDMTKKAVANGETAKVKKVKSEKKLKVKTVDANKKPAAADKLDNEITDNNNTLKNNFEENSGADVAYQKKIAQDKLEALKRESQIVKQKPRKKVRGRTEFSISKIIKPAIIALLVIAMFGFGVLAFMSRDKGLNTVQTASTVEVVKQVQDKSNLPQFKPGKTNSSAEALTNFKLGTIEQLLKTCIEDVYCAVPGNFHWIEINFEDGLSELSATAKTSLSNIVKLMKGYPEMKLAIKGHTAYGEVAENPSSLSEQRSKLVFNYLVENNISTDRLSYKGMADEQPISFGNSLTSKHNNKRIDFTISQK